MKVLVIKFFEALFLPLRKGNHAPTDVPLKA